MASEIAKFEADFSFVQDRINEFFDRGTVRRALDLLDEVGITGWEKWWQVEFAAWLSDHDHIAEWVMEEVFLTDLRKKTQKNSIAIDIGFRMKGFSTKEMLFLELKQNNDWKRCIENMLVDVDKVETSQTYSESNRLMIRNFFVVGVYPTGDTTKKDVHAYVEGRAAELDIPLDKAHIFTKFVKDSPFSVTVF
jgi:hypothetical protein